MSPTTLRLVAVFLALGVAAAARAQPQSALAPRQLTLAECIDLALRYNPDVATAEEEVAASLAARGAMRGNFGPKGRVEFTALRWDSPVNFDLGGFSALLPPGVSIPPVREQTTTSLTLSAVQPLGALWSIYEGYKVRDLGVDVAKVRRMVTLRDTAFGATEAFYRTLQTMRLAEVARMSVEQLEAQVVRARSFFTHGLIGNNDLLRAELGLAAARQRLIQARGTVTLAQGRLAFVLGLPAETMILPVGAPTEPPPPDMIAEDEAARRALTSRIEIRELEARIEQAGGGVRASWSKMLPDLNAVFSYQRNTGSSFQPNAYFGGVSLAWTFWEWGATYYGVPEAKARQRQALAARAKLRDGIRLETRQAWVTQMTAGEALGVVQSAVVQAEESFRLESKRYEARANTSFDVIDAETQLTQARAQLQTALYDYLIARAALARAMGEGPVAKPPRAERPASPEDTHAAP